MSNPIWMPKICDYVISRLPKDERGLNDHAMTAWQFGCMLLCALGYAEEQPWGASLRETQNHPAVLPPVEDIAVAVLAVAEQWKEAKWLRLDGTPMPPKPLTAAGAVWMRVGETSPWPPPSPTVHAAHGLGPGCLSEEVQAVLTSLGLIQNESWTPAARMVLWRVQPRVWDMDVSSDSEFQTGVERCLDTMPGDVSDRVRGIALPPTDQEIKADLNQMLAIHAEHDRRVREHGRNPPPPDKDALRRRIILGWETRKTYELEHVFHARWRLNTGWHPEENALLPLFHDPLARQMLDTVRERIG